MGDYVLATQIGKYIGTGVVIAFGDKILAVKTQNKLDNVEVKQNYVKAMKTLNHSYSSKKFQKKLENEDFRDALATTRDYFQVYKKEHPTIDDTVQDNGLGIIGKAKDKWNNAKKSVEYSLKHEKINNLKLKTKAFYSFMIPLAMDIGYAFGGTALGQEAPKSTIAEFAETPFEFAGLLTGLTIGKVFSKFISAASPKADNNLRMLEDKLLSNDFLREQIYKDFHPAETIVKETKPVGKVVEETIDTKIEEQVIEKPKAETPEERKKRIQDLRDKY
ncbi:MAG: hypothetical protein ABIB43_01335 [archaeon]